MRNFIADLRQGHSGENKIFNWLRHRQWTIIPAYAVSESSHVGPRILSPTADLISPDALIIRDKQVVWIDAKTKSYATWYGIGKRFETGIDKNCWNNYLKVSKITQLPLWLLFLQESSESNPIDIERYGAPQICPTGLYCGESDLIRNVSHESDKRGSGGMIYWGVDSLTKLAEI
jgi:hypothetical protein